MTIDTDTRSELAELKDEYCDAYKDIHGVKGRFIYGMDLTVAEVKEMLVQLQEEYLAHRAREIAREQKNIKAAQNLIGGLIARGAKDVATAIRWMHQTYNTGGDNGFLDYELGTTCGRVYGVLKNGLV